MNARFQIAIHILTLLSKAGNELLSSEYIAGSLNTNPALVRKEISNLRNHGLIDSKEGKNGGYALARKADKITLDQVLKTVKTGAVFGKSKNQPNPDCPVGKQISQNISKLYDNINDAVLSRLNKISLADFSRRFD
jgi:Rrf2 family protein